MSNDTWDFGFTAVDDPFEHPPVSAVVSASASLTAELRDEIMTKLARIEASLLNSDSSDMINDHRSLVEQDVAKKLKQVEDLIMPLLYNLQKNPEKDYILWPNRVAIIDKQIEKIKAITRYYNEI
jgi:hypothetical protein